MNARTARRKKIIFVTGTDTGVGKTIFTGLLLHHLRSAGRHVLAMKPFCSGTRADVKLLRAMQDRELTEDEINPWYFSEPVAPIIAARKHRRRILFGDVVRRIKKLAARCDTLLIEGSGGLLVPLGEKYGVGDLIRKLKCEVIVVARNRLGTINHTLLTVSALRNLGVRRLRIVLMTGVQTDVSSMTNGRLLAELLKPIAVETVGFLGKNANKSGSLKKSSKKTKKTLARFCG